MCDNLQFHTLLKSSNRNLRKPRLLLIGNILFLVFGQPILPSIWVGSKVIRNALF